MPSSPVALFVYNRPWHARQTIESLRKNLLAAETDVIIFSDGPKTEVDARSVEEVRDYLCTVEGFRSVTRRESPVNKGLAKSIIEGVTEVLCDHESIIVIEDDMITSPYFLSYMNQGLILYEHDEEVVSIHGYVYPVKAKLPESFFLRGADCWGWATWRRGWALFEPDGRVLLEELKAKGLTDEFDYENTYPFTKMLAHQIAGLNDSWAIRWQASAFLKDRLTLYPGASMVRNIGFDNSGTHSGVQDKVFDVEVNREPVKLEKIALTEMPEARKAFSHFFKSTKPSLAKRAMRKIGSWIKR